MADASGATWDAGPPAEDAAQNETTSASGTRRPRARAGGQNANALAALQPTSPERLSQGVGMARLRPSASSSLLERRHEPCEPRRRTTRVQRREKRSKSRFSRITDPRLAQQSAHTSTLAAPKSACLSGEFQSSLLIQRYGTVLLPPATKMRHEQTRELLAPPATAPARTIGASSTERESA